MPQSCNILMCFVNCLATYSYCKYKEYTKISRNIITIYIASYLDSSILYIRDHYNVHAFMQMSLVKVCTVVAVLNNSC